MIGIGGNITAQVQTKGTRVNQIGERVASWETVETLTGFLDLQSGESKFTNFSAKLQESTHVFVCDYVELPVTPENSRLIVNNQVYEITLIDDPMELHYQLEIYLKFVGGQR